MIAYFKNSISYPDGCVTYTIHSGEHREYTFLQQKISDHILQDYIKNGVIECYPPNDATPAQEQTTPDPVAQQAPELIYKTAEALVNSEGANIKKGTKMTQQEIFDAGLDFQQLIAEGKLMEVKMTK